MVQAPLLSHAKKPLPHYPGAGSLLAALDICAGGGGEALGLESSGFMCAGAVDNDKTACATLRQNRPDWRVVEDDIHNVSGLDFRGVDLLAGGVPCPPFSIAGKQLGADDERNLFPQALRLIREAKPAAVMPENVPGFAATRFSGYRANLLSTLQDMGYDMDWRILNASDFGVPQLRPRFVLVAMKRRYFARFHWPLSRMAAPSVGDTIGDLIASRGWPGAETWSQNAQAIAPTLVGGSKKHGGPDLGPTRAKKQWTSLGVDGMGIANEPPDAIFPVDGHPRLTLRMTARLQAFPASWAFAGGKTAVYRQIGNALPPPVAYAVGAAIKAALDGRSSRTGGKRRSLVQPVLLFA
jgi:DNA (cytosine-5)-methyltransferase 1